MSFRELIKRYREGTATKEEILQIQKELEKYEAIEEYLSDSLDLDFINDSNDEKVTSNTDEIQKNVNKRLRKVVLTSVSIVMAIIIGAFYIISPVVDSIYYNPNDYSISDIRENLFYDLYVFTELNLPGYGISSPTVAESLGFGSYNIYMGRSKQFTHTKEVVNMKLQRGRLISMDGSIRPAPFIYFPTYADSASFDEELIENNNKRILNHLRQLSPVSYVSAALTFDRDLTMEEFHELQWDYGVDFIWVGIRTEPEEEPNKSTTGFRISNTAVTQINNTPDRERYPAFDFWEWLRENERSTNISHWPEAYELHYKSLLRYMIDREEAVLTFEAMPSKYEFYKTALEYVEENGVKTYGALVFANPESLIKLVENGPVKTMGIDEVLASRRFIY